MFQDTFAAELATRIGSRIEIMTDNSMIEGILSSVTANLVLVVEIAGGYGENTTQFLSIDAISFVRFPAAAA
ncbi:hypothetical protein [Lentibacillus jeotgali]|uniref:hypothetical protein n=1 Tax=Lentibacillus jeotgali TaxID=558169 RepID=UPI00026273B8|nr:hypothetical protein [Lentibacillus jeotgali]